MATEAPPIDLRRFFPASCLACHALVVAGQWPLGGPGPDAWHLSDPLPSEVVALFAGVPAAPGCPPQYLRRGNGTGHLCLDRIPRLEPSP